VRSGVNAKEWKAVYASRQLQYAGLALAGIVTGTLRIPPVMTNATVNAVARQDYLTGLSYVNGYTRADDAVSALERAVSADADSPLTNAALAEAQWHKYILTGDKLWLGRTEESARQAELRNPDLAEVHQIAGLLNDNVGLYEQAVRDYQRTIELQPNNANAYRRLGLVYDKTNQLDEAREAFRSAIRVAPTDFRNHRQLANFQFNRGDYEAAVSEFMRTVELAPNVSDSHFVLATAQRELGRFAESERELRAAIHLEDTSDAEHALGYLLMLEGRDREAISCYRRALTLGSETAQLRLNLGISYHRAGLETEAKVAFQRGLILAELDMKDPRNGSARAYLAYLAARLGDRVLAESEIAQALRLSPDHADTRWMAVLTYEALGRREDSLGLLANSPRGVIAQLNRYPDLAALQHDTRFIELLTSKRVP
jgi:tetratricopeptide (TPR) repeat protein